MWSPCYPPECSGCLAFYEPIRVLKASFTSYQLACHLETREEIICRLLTLALLFHKAKNLIRASSYCVQVSVAFNISWLAEWDTMQWTNAFFNYYYLLLGQGLERGSKNFGRSSARQLAALRRVGAKGAWPRCPAKCGHVEGVSIKQIPHLNHPWTLSLTSNDPVWLLWRLHIIHHVSPTDRKACFSPHFYVPADIGNQSFVTVNASAMQPLGFARIPHKVPESIAFSRMRKPKDLDLGVNRRLSMLFHRDLCNLFSQADSMSTYL